MTLIADTPVSSPQDPPPQPATADVVLDLLGLIAHDTSALPSEAQIATWPQDDRDAVADWARLHHLRASDDNIDVPACPEVIRGIEGLGVPLGPLPARFEEEAAEALDAAGSAERAPIKSVAAIDDSNLVTDSAAAAHACPECEALMKLETEDESGHHDDDEGPFKPLLRCTNPDCAHVMEPPVAPTTETAAAPIRRAVRCEMCGRELLIEMASSGHGFRVINGANPGETFGCSPNGFPICPKDGVALIPLGPVAATEAIAAAADAGKRPDEFQPRLPEMNPPFDFQKAYRAEHRLRKQVREAEEDYASAAELARDRKKTLDRLNEQLGKLMDEHERREKEAGLERRGSLLPEQNSVCFSERMTGKPCHVCREARKKAKEAGTSAANDRLLSVQQHAERRGLHLEHDELIALQRDAASTFEALERWAHDETAKLATVEALADLVKRACVAGPVGENDAQRCTTCGVLLHNKTDGDATGATPYPEGDSVGLDCVGAPDASTQADTGGDAPEPARQLPKRHKSPKDAAAAKSKATREKRPALKAGATKKPAAKGTKKKGGRR